MPWIEQVADEAASGRLERLYDEAVDRAGRVWNIVRIMSIWPAVLEASMRLYTTLMKGPSPLPRARRELLATVVSAELGCRY